VVSRISRGFAAAAVFFAAAASSVAVQQGRDAFIGSINDPAIDYLHAPLTDPVSRLASAIEDGKTSLTFDAATGYLASVLQQLDVPVESQVLVTSQTSLQAPMISRSNPRALYFNDSVAVGWVRGAPVLELASQDPRQGTIFYRLDQRDTPRPRLERSTECLRCHIAWETLAVPGPMVLSTGPDDAAGYATGGVVDHRDPIPSRWGSWYVTGRSIPPQHLGMAITAPPWAAAKADLTGYLTPHSDVVALMTLEHQTHAANLITYLGWEGRVGASPGRLDQIVRLLVDYFLFVDEAPLPQHVEGSSAFAGRFAARGPRDRRGRSLREFDLDRRLMKYPCSYMIYSPAFDALPAEIRDRVYRRILEVLDAPASEKKYARLSGDDRRAVREILGETKPDFPSTAIQF
jgi:hypothetical protein